MRADISRSGDIVQTLPRVSLHLRLPGNPDDEGNEVDEKTVSGGNQGDGDGAPDDIRVGVLVQLDGIADGHELAHSPEDAGGQAGEAGFPDPGRGFPGNEEQGDEKEGDNCDSVRIGGTDNSEKTGFKGNRLPSMLWNPVFVAAVLAILAYGHYLLEKWLDKKYPSDRPVTFTSDYRKVSVRKEDILYIESRDSEVWIHTRDGQQYRNKTGIGQWENALGPGFLRIHRAFLVNRMEATMASPESVRMAGKELPVSRKYKDVVSTMLTQ